MCKASVTADYCEEPELRSVLSTSPVLEPLSVRGLFNSSSMMRTNSLSGWAPESKRPLMKKDGVLCIPRRFASSSSFCTTLLNFPLSRHFVKSETLRPACEA